MIRSLRLRLLIGTSLATALVLALLGLAIYFFAWRSLTAQFDTAMLVKARALASMVEQDGAKITFDYDPKDLPEFLAGRRAEYFQVWLDNGSTLVRSTSLASRDLPRFDTPVAREITLPDGHRGRAITIVSKAKIQLEGDESPAAKAIAPRTATLTVAAPTRSLAETLEQLALILSVACSAAVVISGVILLWVVRRSLKPVGRLAREIEAMHSPSLGQRLSQAGVPAELVPVVEKLNQLLDRLSAAFTREKAFTADAAHELRTPLAGLQAIIEVCRSRPRGADEYDATLAKCAAIVTGMERMVSGLLMLARAEAGQLTVRRKPFDLCNTLDECWSLLHDRAAARGLTLGREMPPGQCLASGDPDHARIIFQNLLDNAVSHADRGGRIQIAVELRDGRPSVVIRNTGSSIDPADVPRLFDRFWRGDVARTDVGLHCGLGLSLCQRLVQLGGGDIEVSSQKGGEFSVRVTLPPGDQATLVTSKDQVLQPVA